jgi:hypothetical protein
MASANAKAANTLTQAANVSRDHRLAFLGCLQTCHQVGEIRQAD